MQSFMEMYSLGMSEPFLWNKNYIHHISHQFNLNIQGGSVVKNSPAKQKMQVQTLDQEDPLEEGMATHSSIFAWRILWTEEPGRLQSTGSQVSDTTQPNKNNSNHTHT